MESANITQFREGSVRGFLHRPDEPGSAGLVLTHGAGSNCRAPLIVAVAEAFCSAGLLVLRCDLPFRQNRPFGPPFPKTAAEDRAGLKDAITALRDLGCTKAFLGGHSYGGRQASILASEDPEVTDALLLMSYPLHPPKKPDQLRTDHFPRLQTPSLFLHGTKDPFGSIEEITAALRLISAPTKVVSIDGAGHDLARGKFDLEQLVAEFRNLSASASAPRERS
ncbi:MAG: dienelactone hydrolase family protein [Acidobacteriaceae bacterium]|nr:dienelactone hydrolase family protein [Acidobacteriaceae bacterium]